MARKLRIEYPGALYHVINRGNYRSDVFGTVGAAKAFEDTLHEGVALFGWKLHAYVVMRNHYHLAIETPLPNLVEGMHWLQSTYCTRFNRFRGERGHVFQGRYQALLIENDAALARVANYIHLNPVRARIVEVENVASFRWSSLRHFQKSQQTKNLVATRWMAALGCEETKEGWERYGKVLRSLVNRPESAEQDDAELCHGWAIGTYGWRRAMAREYAHFAIELGIPKRELAEIKEEHRRKCLSAALGEVQMSLSDCSHSPLLAEWKCVVAERLRSDGGASYSWIARELNMGKEASVRSYLSRRRNAVQQYSA